jgi:XTP/dITP diphosphohydrolase
VLALAQHGEILAIISDAVEGTIADRPRGAGGFGYDPVFVIRELGQSFSELTGDMKHRYSHRGKAFRKLLRYVTEL